MPHCRVHFRTATVVQIATIGELQMAKGVTYKTVYGFEFRNQDAPRAMAAQAVATCKSPFNRS